MSIDINYIEKIIEADATSSILKKELSLFRDALNDWPFEIYYLSDYVNEVEKTINGKADKKTLLNFIENVNALKFAWQIESISQIIELYDYHDDNKTLNEILIEITRDFCE